MSKFDWNRKGPPRPGSGLGHPFGAERPYKPPRDLQQSIDQTQRERERQREHAQRMDRRDAAIEHWANTPPSEIARVVAALVSTIENAPAPGPTETMREFRVRFNEWLGAQERCEALRVGRGES